MPSYLDLALLGIVLVSALLSMVRGFSREVLAIASWAAAAVAAYYCYPLVMPYLEHYIPKDMVRMIVSIGIVFFVTLILVSIITVKLSDAILDSKVGALDRTLGFVFGAARGFLLGVVAFLFFTWLAPVKPEPEWIATAKSRPLLQATGTELASLMPAGADGLMRFLKREKTAPVQDAPADADGPTGTDAAPAAPATPARRTDASPPPASPKPADTAGVTAADKARLNATIAAPEAAKPANKKP